MSADFQSFGPHPDAPDPTACVQVRLANGALGQIFMCYEVPPGPGYGTNSNNQYSSSGRRGSSSSTSTISGWATSRAGRRCWSCRPWINPLQPHNPRRIKRSALQVQGFIDALRDGRKPPITGEDGRAASRSPRPRRAPRPPARS